MRFLAFARNRRGPPAHPLLPHHIIGEDGRGSGGARSGPPTAQEGLMKRALAVIVLATFRAGCVALQRTPDATVLRPLRTIAVIPLDAPP